MATVLSALFMPPGGTSETAGVQTLDTAQRWDEDLDDELLKLLIGRAAGFEARLRYAPMLHLVGPPLLNACSRRHLLRNK